MPTGHAQHVVDAVGLQLVVLSLIMAQPAHIHAIATGPAELAPAGSSGTCMGAHNHSDLVQEVLVSAGSFGGRCNHQDG